MSSPLKNNFSGAKLKLGRLL